MIQFNLLPDVKLAYIRAKNTKRTVTVVSALVAATTGSIFVLLFLTVNVFQKTHIEHLNGDIKEYSTKLSGVKDLNKVITIQNQLSSLPSLHDKKPVTSRLFGYLGQVVPSQVNIGKLDVDFANTKIIIGGTTDSLQTVNKFADTLKFTTYASEGGDSKKDVKPFSDVVLSSFSKTDKEATYEISLTFDELIFDSSVVGKLNVPKTITSRSQTEKPSDLFKDLPANTVNGGQ